MLLCFTSALAAEGIPLNRATFTDVVNDVAVLKASSNARIPVKKDDQVSAPDLVRTGDKSRAELKAPDNTLTRIGANTVLSFKQDGRGINLEQGSVLFHSPTGKGGGTIQTAAVTAAVTGTTIIVVCTKNGGFKLLVLEGKGKATSGGHSVTVGAGQLVFVLPGAKGFSPVFNYQLMNQTQKSGLVHGFNGKLASQDKIDHAIDQQNDQILNGKMVVTDLLVSDGDASNSGVPVVSQTTLENQIGDSAFLAALFAAFSKDIMVSSSTPFPQDQIFGIKFFAGAEVFLGVHDSGGGNDNDPSNLALVGRNITVQSPLNLSPYAGVANFVIASNGTLILPVSLSIIPGPNNLTFFGKTAVNGGSMNYPGGIDLEGGQVNMPSGSTLQGNSPNGNHGVGIRSYSDLNLNNVNLINSNPTGFVEAETEGNLTMNGGSMVGATSSMSGGIQARSGLDMNIVGTTFSSNYTEFDSGGSATLSSPTFTGPTGYTTQFYAGGSLTVTSPNFSGSAGYIRMDATKIILNNVNFPTSANVDLFTQTGNWSTISAVPGGVYLNNCTYGTLITGSGTAGVVATAGGNQLQSLHH
ncbi:MAG: FecR domain-containing protein [Methylacidiphilales bacterium]|nr:FecR domain-containing protein [Candidatus Methylacidiphilales bacterium]